MKFKVEKASLINAIQTVQNVITTKSALPILANILIEAQAGTLKLTATDLDIGITCVIPVDIQEAGAITIPAKRFSDIIKEFPLEMISVTTKKNNQVIIDSNMCQFKIMGLIKEEFPKEGYLNGILHIIDKVGEVLKNEFPKAAEDIDELPDEVVVQ